MDGTQIPNRVALRPPEQVMRLSRMGNFHPMRLSFMRILLRRIRAERWDVSRPVWDIDEKGVGRAVYTAKGPEHAYSLIVYSHDLPDHLRSDRVIAEAWDATFTLFDGVPTEVDLDRLQKQVPIQEAGRLSIGEFTLSRANRSVRLFAHVVDALAAGRQPDPQELAKVGYLMRTTAVYGSGKFGLADRDVYSNRPELNAPFQAEMLTVWLIRAFSIDIVEHMARVKGGTDAVRLDPDLRRSLGIGNSTGLGMAPFLLTHPVLIHSWISAREEAFARVRALPEFSAEEWQNLRVALQAAISNIAGWQSEHPIQVAKLTALRSDVDLMAGFVGELDPRTSHPAEVMWQWAERNLGEDAQELLVSLLLEPFGAMIDDLADQMSADERADFAIDAQTKIADLSAMIDAQYDWALACDWQDNAETARLWYVSAEKLEPRLAERADEPLEAYEQPLAPAREVAALRRALAKCQPEMNIAEFLEGNPSHRDAVRRVQNTAKHDYAEVRDNTVAARMLPIDLLRAKLSFFGATRFDPRSDRWVRITMFNNAPFPDEIHEMKNDAWMYGVEVNSSAAKSAAMIRHIAPSLQSNDGQQAEDTGWSMGEISALSAKAVRGAGLPWGIAAEAARAVQALSEMGLPGAEALALDLDCQEAGATLMLGCRIADSDDIHHAETVACGVSVLLLLPFLQQTLSEGYGYSVLSADGQDIARICRDGAEFDTTTLSLMEHIRIERCPAFAVTVARNRILQISDSALKTLNKLAVKTYAPATEASRLKGAGAGVLDND